MKQALAQATLAADKGEVPIGAVLWSAGRLIAEGHNQVEQERKATRHAEIVVLDRASEVLGGWRLLGSVLCVTIEPCTMCLGAIALARVGTVIFGARQPVTGALGSLYDLSTQLTPELRWISGVCKEECQRLIQDFFSGSCR
jgi:tRNA(adenine34) deaminase